MGEILSKAITIATRAHRDQVRKQSALPYIVHPLEVMNTLVQYGYWDQTLLSAAVLHDVIEDCHEIFQADIKFLSIDVYYTVLELTNSSSKEKTNLNLSRASRSAQLVKVADIKSNTRDSVSRKYLVGKLKQLDCLEKVINTVLWLDTYEQVDRMLYVSE